jgi:hypothetical protein
MADTPFRTSGRVAGEDFFGRAKSIRTVVHQLRGKSNVAIIGPSKSGKSSILALLFKNYKLAEKDAFTWYVDMANLASLGDLINEFYIGMHLNTTNPSLATFGQALRDFNDRLIIFIDSADRFSRPPFNEEAFFALLATYLQRQHVSMCIATTIIPNEVFTNRIGLPLSTFFFQSYLEPFTIEECFAFISQRLQWTGIFFKDTEIHRLFIESGGYPWELQKMAAELYREKMAALEDGRGGGQGIMQATYGRARA